MCSYIAHGNWCCDGVSWTCPLGGASTPPFISKGDEFTMKVIESVTT
jgi:hypothetical protein